MTKTAALEQGSRGIRVNAAAPGPIAGRMTFKLADEVFADSKKTFAETIPLGRHGTPEDVATCARQPHCRAADNQSGGVDFNVKVDHACGCRGPVVSRSSLAPFAVALTGSKP
jgi:NAD(P)-dependent dehydrogenase (short-subunit alcohol dehydrogenase family)